MAVSWRRVGRSPVRVNGGFSADVGPGPERQRARTIRQKPMRAAGLGMPALIPVSKAWCRGRHGRLYTKFRMGVYIESERHVRLVIGDLPRESTENHAHEDDGARPDIGQSWIVLALAENLRRQIRIRADNTSRRNLVLARVVENSGRTEINEFDNVFRSHDTVIKLQISVSKTHRMKVVDTVDNLAEDTIDFRTRHLARHDNREQVIRCVLHDLCAFISSCLILISLVLTS